jgi:hypothetical protein
LKSSISCLHRVRGNRKLRNVVPLTKPTASMNLHLAMNFFSVILLLLLFTCSLTATAQTDTIYIGSFKHKNFLQLYAGSFSRKINFTPSGKEAEQHQINLSPNSSAFCGFVLGYKKITLYGDVALPQTAKLNRQQTNVRAFSFFASHFNNKWGFTGFVSYNRGLLMAAENIPAMYNNRNDIRKFTVGVHSYRIFNASKFSYVAANTQQMQQKKNAGSLILVLTPSYRIMQSAVSIIPFEKSKYHLRGEMTMSRQIELVSVQLKPGYAYNFIWKKGAYFLAPSVYAGPGGDYHQLIQTNTKYTGINFNLGYRAKLTAGINRERFFGTLEILQDHTRSFIYRSVYKNTYTECSLNAGWRF